MKAGKKGEIEEEEEEEEEQEEQEEGEGGEDTQHQTLSHTHPPGPPRKNAAREEPGLPGGLLSPGARACGGAGSLHLAHGQRCARPGGQASTWKRACGGGGGGGGGRW